MLVRSATWTHTKPKPWPRHRVVASGAPDASESSSAPSTMQSFQRKIARVGRKVEGAGASMGQAITHVTRSKVGDKLGKGDDVEPDYSAPPQLVSPSVPGQSNVTTTGAARRGVRRLGGRGLEVERQRPEEGKAGAGDRHVKKRGRAQRMAVQQAGLRTQPTRDHGEEAQLPRKQRVACTALPPIPLLATSSSSTASAPHRSPPSIPEQRGGVYSPRKPSARMYRAARRRMRLRPGTAPCLQGYA
eukprot:366466-Chlamydomonas_euryale.AAC.5